MLKKWTLSFSESALKQLRKLDAFSSKTLLSYLKEHILSVENPRVLGKPGSLSSFWRFRKGDYRIIVEFKDENFVIHVVALDHRKDIYTH